MSDKMIIHRPELLSRFRRRTEWGLTTLGWLVWIVLCRPLMVIVLWCLGVQQMYRQMVALGGFSAVILFFEAYIFIILGVGALLRGWSAYNQWRFRGKERRQAVAEVTPSELERTFRLPAGGGEWLQQGRTVAITFEARNALVFEVVGPDTTTRTLRGHRGPLAIH